MNSQNMKLSSVTELVNCNNENNYFFINPLVFLPYIEYLQNRLFTCEEVFNKILKSIINVR